MKKITLFIAALCMLSINMMAQSKQAVNAMRAQDAAFVTAPVPMQQPPSNASALSISGFYQEGFEGATFPPTGWNRVNVAGSNQWVRSTAQAHLSTTSAFIQYQTTAAEDWLIMPRFLVGATTDSVTFWMRLAYSGYAPDSLCIKVSTTDSLTSSFTTTLLKLREGVNYPANSTTWYQYKVSLQAYVGQQIYVGFKHYNNNGDGLYIDDVTIGTKPAAEVTTTAILTSASLAQSSITPQASFYNNGSAAQSFNVTMQVTPGGYTSTMPVSNLAPGASTTVTFGSWTPSAPGSYTMKAFTQLAGDANTQNDTLQKTVTVLATFPNNGWSAQTALPAGRWATAPAFTIPCVSSTDTGYIHLISGSDAAFANTTLNSRYNTVTNTWTTKAPIPTSRLQITPVQVKNKIYVIGGYTSGFTPTNITSIYDVLTDTWTTGANMTAAVGDYAIGVYGDSLIYVVGGYNGSGDVNTVQIYNVNTNTWMNGTPKTGSAVAGGRMGISGNNIVFVGGYSQTLAATLSNAYVGTINPASPQTITWTAIANYPAGPSGRLGAGVAFQNNGRVYFAGGDPNGQGTTVLANVYAYNTATAQWEVGPNMITGVSNISGLAGVVKNNTQYLVTMGGYNGATVGSYNEWLEIGPANPLPTAQADTAICVGSSFSLDAFNGLSYSWTPATALSSTTTASTIASPTVTTTYSVTMSKGYGCLVNDAVMVTVNSLPAAAASSDAVICAGDNTPLTASGGDTYAWSPVTGLSNPSIDSPVASPATTTTYTVTVTSTTTGCSNTDDVMVTVNALPVAAAGSDVAICSGDSAMLMATGGDTYTWSPATGLANSAMDNTSAGPASTTTYTVTVTSTSTGCSNTDDVMVTVNSLPAVTTSSTDATCNGLGNGAATAMVTGASTYSYTWSTGGTAATETSLSMGTYTVTVTDDATGCMTQDVATVNEPSALSASVMNDTTATSCAGTLTATVTGGTPGYTYMWNDPSSQTAATATGLCAGTYLVMITDANGCVFTSSGEVVITTGIAAVNGSGEMNVYPNPSAGVVHIEAMFVSEPAAIMLVNVLGERVMMIDESINGAYSKSIDISSLPAGIYYVQVREGNEITSVKKIVKQ